MKLAVSAVVLPDLPPAELCATARAVEQAGARTVWTYDHLSWRDLRDGPWHAAMPLLGAVAAATSSVRLGTLVASPNFRHPVTLAKEAMTLDWISEGRLDLGVGAGGIGADATVLGAPAWTPCERAEKFEEWVVMLDSLLREPVVSMQGRHFSVSDARMVPGCVQRPRVPLTVAAAGPRSLRLAARVGQAWVTYGPIGSDGTPEAFWAGVTGQVAVLAGAPLRRLLVVGLDQGWPTASAGAYQEFNGRAAELGFDEVIIHWPRPDGRGVPAALLERVLAVHS